MNRIKKTSLHIMQITAFLMIIMAFIPFLNPFRFGEASGKPFVAMLWNAGEIGSYFAEQNVNALSLNSTMFGYVLGLILALVFVLMTTLLTLRLTESSRPAIKTGMFFGIAMSVVFFLLFLEFTDLNTQILSAHSGDIGRKIQIFTKIPLGVYLFFILSVVYSVTAYIAYNFDFDAIWYNFRSTFANRFKGGIHPPYHKEAGKKAVMMVQTAQYMIYPLAQHIGAMCQPLVEIGDNVMIGQKIADSDSFISAPIHATVSGKVAAIELRPHPTLNEVMSIVIENDFEDRLNPMLADINRDYTQLETDEMIGYIREAGIVGMGGAAFPTHVKLKGAVGKVDTVIINAAECEPYLSGDHRLMLENTAEFVEGVKIIRDIIGARRVYVGVESNKPDAISVLYRAFRKTRIRVAVLPTKYPQGGEKQLIKSITGREVPSGKLPADIGCSVFNVDTAIAVYRAVVKGYPLMRRIMTVAGEALKQSGNVNVRIGTPIDHLLRHFGLKEHELKKVIMGGPMMGNAICNLSAPVVKGTAGLLCFTEKQLVEDRDDHSCIRCGRCITVCPMRLAPNYLRLYAVTGEMKKCAELGAMDCIECGCCSYTCPAKLPILQHIRIAKQWIKEQPKKKD